MRRPRGLAVLTVTAVLMGGPAGCAEEDPFADYCEAVREHQAELGEIVSEGGPAALIAALDIFRDLQAQAPDDITDEWRQVVSRVEALERALDEAGVDPATYDRKAPPADLAQDERERIEEAAAALVDPATVAALDGLEQQARDVCKTQLTL